MDTSKNLDVVYLKYSIPALAYASEIKPDTDPGKHPPVRKIQGI